MTAARESNRRALFIALCVAVFVLVFVASALLKVLWKDPEAARYQVAWDESIGTVVSDVTYGDAESNTFDLYLPAGGGEGPYGLVVYLHAGGFTTGDKADDAAMLQWLCSKGYVAAGINYTLRDDAHPEASVYSQSLEIRDAMPAVVAEAEKLGYKIDGMAIGGGSAGGTLAMLYAYRDAKESPVPVKMLFEAVGPSSFYPEDWGVYGLDQNLENAGNLFGVMLGEEIDPSTFGTAAYDEQIKPISGALWVDEGSVPTVIAYGVHDKVCPFDSSKHLAKALEDNHVTYSYFELPHSGHALQNDTKLYLQYMAEVENYLDTYLPVK
ncbi:alpha/beta hydrolase fold domain-containing protein [Collinsella aerofaciens]|uniref:alpha/beta hydrolase fold domain-containing protein n=1 Tax=Collinsella aerofaciens TaxID=74426 RepID=UPI003D7A45E8